METLDSEQPEYIPKVDIWFSHVALIVSKTKKKALDSRGNATASSGLGSLITNMQQSVMGFIDQTKKYRKMIKQDQKYVAAFEQIMDIYEDSQFKGLLFLALIAGDDLDDLLIAVMSQQGNDQLTEMLDNIENIAMKVPILKDPLARVKFGHQRT